MSNLGFSENTDTYTDLKRRYNENHRKYHNVAHIESVLIEFGKTRYIAENNSSVELALWFHDAIYNTFSKSNEKERSSEATTKERKTQQQEKKTAEHSEHQNRVWV